MSAGPYSAAELDNVLNPRNAGHLHVVVPGVLTAEAGEGTGERVRLQLRVGAAGRIEASRFKAFGCPATIAAASYAALRLEGATLERAVELRADEISNALDLAPAQRALAELPLRALDAALRQRSS